MERKFPLHSPRIANIVVKRSGKVRRAKLYYLRHRSGKAVRLKERFSAQATAQARAAKAERRAAPRRQEGRQGSRQGRGQGRRVRGLIRDVQCSGTGFVPRTVIPAVTGLAFSGSPPG